MKYKSVKLSELGIDCWSAKRIFNICHECDRVTRCKLPEAHKGRVVLAGNRLLETTKLLTKHVNDLGEQFEKSQ